MRFLAPVLALLNSTSHLTLNTDACDVQIGCVVLQEQPNKTFMPIEYWSMSLINAERKYDTTRRWFLAIVWAILLLLPYLENSGFTIRTDHDSFKWIINLKDSTGETSTLAASIICIWNGRDPPHRIQPPSRKCAFTSTNVGKGSFAKWEHLYISCGRCHQRLKMSFTS